MPPDSPSFPFRLHFPPDLPISARAEEIVAAIQANQVVVLAGETGSGKTTQIPKMCLAAGRGVLGRIACTQPRRVAALSVSRRVADELGVDWGREVGCKIRFNDHTSSDTVIKFMTDGMLLAEVQSDPLLRGYDTIILDEAHERSLNIDFLLGHLRTLRYKRPELKVVITSATIDTEAFSKAFDDAPVIQVSGRAYSVEVIYAPLDSFGSDYAQTEDGEVADAAAEASAKAEALHYIDGALEAVERIIRDSDSGDILVFMPAERDIRELGELLDGRRLHRCEIVPLYGRLSNSEQQRVFAPSQQRKIVLATNIAETSLTIPGIRFVVDTGLARVSRYSPQARTRRLPIEEISQSSADQRKGRCGRVAEGVCIRLYSERDFLERPRFTQPEIQRANLADVILRMKAFGLGDIERFPFINMPAAKSIRAGYGLLEELGAIEPQRVEDRGQGAEDRGQRTEVRPGVVNAGSLPGTDLSEPASEVRHLTTVLTPLGRELARLPVDPTAGRMILQARVEKCVREVLVIASGLSIQDPRERPLEKQVQADAAHRRFAHPDSDFLTLLNIWDAFHDEVENMAQAKLRRFCRDHFLSYTRMREWRDVHAQLLDVLKERADFKFTSAFQGIDPKDITPEKEAFGTPAYRAIHRAILSGLLGNIGIRDDEKGGYKATHDRRVTLFPGSVLFNKADKKKEAPAPGGGRPNAPKKDSKSPRWLMAAEIMETSRLYARTCARLDPLWALELGEHLLKISHSEPFWDATNGRVLVKRRIRLHGLEMDARAVSYGKVDPAHATEIFIREALVNDAVTWPFDFLAHNRETREKVENLLTRARDSDYMNLDEAVYRFYAQRLLDDESVLPISCVAELVALVRARKGAEPRFLMMAVDDLRDPEELEHDTLAFPEALPIENRAMPLSYAYKPGQADDGVTIDVNIRDAETLTPAALDWAVPGHLEAKVEHYLRATPKELRRSFMPLAETARSVSTQVAQRDRLTGRRETLVDALAALLRERFHLHLDASLWAGKPLPDHLRVRVRVVDEEGKEIFASRELGEIQTALTARAREKSASVAREDPDAWQRARKQWEKPEQPSWTFGDIAESVPVAGGPGEAVLAFPGLKTGEGGVSLRLFKTPEEREASTRRGFEQLFELHVRYEQAWLQKDLRVLRELGTLVATLAPMETLQQHAYESIRRWLSATAWERTREASAKAAGSAGSSASTSAGTAAKAGAARATVAPYLSNAAFVAAVERAKVDVRGLAPRLVEVLRDVLGVRQQLLVHPQPYPGQGPELRALLPEDFLRVTPYAQLPQLPRYLKAMKLRADRRKQNPAKDAERVKELAPFVAAAAELMAKRASAPAAVAEAIEAFRWMVEEFRVSLFAQELGTAVPVSAAKLERAKAELPSTRGKAVVSATGSVPPPKAEPPKTPFVTSVPEKKPAALKSLGALDSLFRR